jgi:hypothetical protein
MKYRTEKIIDDSEWDKLVQETYGKPYIFQQQNGCVGRGLYSLTVPSEEDYDDEMPDSIPEVVNGGIRGIKFAKWLERDPKQPLSEGEEFIREDQWAIHLWWERNFYPCLGTIANDLHKKGLLEAGEYMINVDW